MDNLYIVLIATGPDQMHNQQVMVTETKQIHHNAINKSDICLKSMYPFGSMVEIMKKYELVPSKEEIMFFHCVTKQGWAIPEQLPDDTLSLPRRSKWNQLVSAKSSLELLIKNGDTTVCTIPVGTVEDLSVQTLRRFFDKDTNSYMVIDYLPVPINNYGIIGIHLATKNNEIYQLGDIYINPDKMHLYKTISQALVFV